MMAVFPEGEVGGLSDEIIDFSGEEFARIKCAAKASGISPGLYLANAALEKAARQGALPEQFVAAEIREKLARPQSSFSSITLRILLDFAIRHVPDCPIDEQIVVWRGISEAIADPAARERARRISLIQSEVAALQLEFEDRLSLAGEDSVLPCPEPAGVELPVLPRRAA
jgi:hypothetical protein